MSEWDGIRKLLAHQSLREDYITFRAHLHAALERKPRRKLNIQRKSHVLKSERGGVAEAAAILGLPVRTVQDMAARGELPGAAKFGRRWTFDPEKLRRFVRDKERHAWQSGKHQPDVTGEGIPSGAGLRSAGGSSAGRLTQLIRASQKRASKLARRGW